MRAHSACYVYVGAALLLSGCGFIGRGTERLCRTNAVCGKQEYCSKAMGDCEGVGRCEERPTLIGASLDLSIWCGCDGQTYQGTFTAAGHGTSVAHPGSCGAPAPLSILPPPLQS